jgi:PAS domain S-box-containing protein
MSAKSVQAQLPSVNSPSSEPPTRFRLVADGSPAGLFLVDSAGCCEYMNPCAASILGLNSPVVSNNSWPSAFGLENAASVFESWRATASIRYCGTFRVRTADSGWRWVEVRTAPLLSAGCIVAHAGVVDDVSDRWVSVRRLAARDAITRILAGSDSIDTARSAILNEIGEILGWTIGVFWEADRQAQLLRPTALWRGSGADLSAF